MIRAAELSCVAEAQLVAADICKHNDRHTPCRSKQARSHSNQVTPTADVNQYKAT